MKRDGEMVETIGDLAGLARTRPSVAFALASIMISLAGLPPLAGFWAKLYVFYAAVAAHLLLPAILGVLASAIAAFYYLRIVKIMYFDEPAPAFDRGIGWSVGTIMTGSSLFVLLFIVGGAPVIAIAETSARALFP